MRPEFYKSALLLTLLVLACTFLPSLRLVADEAWVQYQSESGVFSTRVPAEHQAKVSSMAVANKRAICSEEITAVLDQRPYRNILKSYIVKVDQTLGPGLTSSAIDTLIQRELDLYDDFYTAQGGKIKTKEPQTILGFPGGVLQMTYVDPKLGEQHVRMRVLFSGSTRLEQIVTGPEETLNSYKTRDFFKSLTFSDGLSITKHLLDTTWPPKDSALGLFTINVPPVTDPFFPQAPIEKHSKNVESMTFVFKDPVRNESLYYNVYGYRFSRDLILQNAETVLKKNHVLKYKVDPEKIRFKITKDENKRQIIQTAFNITPPPDFPFLQTVNLRGVVVGQSMLVQEVVSSQDLALSPFAETLIQVVKFHPEAYHEPAPEQKPVAPPVETPKTKEAPAPVKEKPADALSQQLRNTIRTEVGPPPVKTAPPTAEESESPATP
jgi:hypothetical protein